MENLIKIQLPISVTYPALEGVLKQKMLGEYIPKQEKGSTEVPYAQILDIALAGSDDNYYDVILRLKIRILRTVLKRDQADLLVKATLDYDNATQQLFVSRFKLDSKTSSGFFNTGIEVLANKVAYNQILKRTRVNLGAIISQEVKKANGLLENGLDVKGAKLTGKAEKVQVLDISPHRDRLSLSLEIQANLEADINDLISLLPPS